MRKRSKLSPTYRYTEILGDQPPPYTRRPPKLGPAAGLEGALARRIRARTRARRKLRLAAAA